MALGDATVWTGRALQAESRERQRRVLPSYPALVGSRSLLAIMDSPRVRSHPQIGPQRPVGSPDHGRGGKAELQLLKSSSQTSAGVSFYRLPKISRAILSSRPGQRGQAQKT
jgi:hypothetical protein